MKASFLILTCGHLTKIIVLIKAKSVQALLLSIQPFNGDGFSNFLHQEVQVKVKQNVVTLHGSQIFKKPYYLNTIKYILQKAVVIIFSTSIYNFNQSANFKLYQSRWCVVLISQPYYYKYPNPHYNNIHDIKLPYTISLLNKLLSHWYYDESIV